MIASERIARLELKVAKLTAELSALKAKLGYSYVNPPAADTRIDGIETPLRVRKCFRRMGIKTFGNLTSFTAMDLLECKNFGVSSLNWVRELLAEHGLSLKGEHSGTDDLRRDGEQDISRALESVSDGPKPPA